MLPWLFLKSTSPTPFAASALPGLEAVDGEATVEIDWDLPLVEDGQLLLFTRIQGDFERQTALVEVKAKKRYRAKEAEPSWPEEFDGAGGRRSRDYAGTRWTSKPLKRSSRMATGLTTSSVRFSSRSHGCLPFP